MSKTKSTERKVRISIWLPEDVAAKVVALLMDPLRGRSRYGDLSRVGTLLFRAWVRKQQRGLEQ